MTALYRRRSPYALALGLATLAPGAEASFKRRDAGTAVAPFLKLAADARGAGMGLASRAGAQDASALLFNPAGLAALSHRHLTFTHGSGTQRVFYDVLGYAQPVASLIGSERPRPLRESQLGAIGVALVYLNTGPIDEVDNTGSSTGLSFRPQDFAAMVGWGASLNRHLDLGASVKFIYSRIHQSAATAAGDVGARWRARFWRMPLTLAVSAQHIGGTLKYNRQPEELPLTVGAGAALVPFRGLTLTGDVIAPRDNRTYFAAGAEYRGELAEKTSFALRAGYNGLNYYPDLEGFSTLTAGGGLGAFGLEADYAWTPFGVLRDIHRFTLSYRF